MRLDQVDLSQLRPGQDPGQVLAQLQAAKPSPGPSWTAQAEARPRMAAAPAGADVSAAHRAEVLGDLALYAPGAPAAWNLRCVAGQLAVPIDPETLEPTGEPFPSGDDDCLLAVLAHYEVRARDGVGLALGVRHLAVSAPHAVFAAWLADRGRRYTRTREVELGWAEEPRKAEEVDYHPIGCPAVIHWQRSPGAWGYMRQVAFRGYAKGTAEALAALNAPPAGTEQAWRLWTVPEDAPQVTPGRRGDLEVLGPGQVIPWQVSRRDGWLLQHVGGCGVAAGPDCQATPWLLEQLGGPGPRKRLSLSRDRHRGGGYEVTESVY